LTVAVILPRVGAEPTSVREDDERPRTSTFRDRDGRLGQLIAVFGAA
jgi:hypothetical protein